MKKIYIYQHYHPLSCLARPRNFTLNSFSGKYTSKELDRKIPDTMAQNSALAESSLRYNVKLQVECLMDKLLNTFVTHFQK